MNQQKLKTAISGLTLFEGIRPVQRDQISGEIIAGITLAALSIPEVLGYAKIAGMPVITGLYTILLPMIVFALLCSSRHLVVGADSATAAIMATSLVYVATPGSPHYVALAAMVALLTGICLFLARVLRIDFIVDFLSRTVLIGFLTGVGVQVAFSQLSTLFGLPKQGDFLLTQLGYLIASLPHTHLITATVSAFVIGTILVGKHYRKQTPWALFIVIGAIILSYLANLESYGVVILGTVPGGLPSITLPNVALSEIPNLFGLTAACFVVIVAQSAATSRAYASRYQESLDEKKDLIGLSLANLVAGLSGTFMVNGSPTKTEIVDTAGGRTQLAMLAAAGVVFIVLAYATAPLSFLPEAVLAAIVFTIGIGLIDVKGMKDIKERRPVEFGVAVGTMISVVLFGVGWGLVVAILLSLIAHIRHSYQHINALLYKNAERKWSPAQVQSGAQAGPGLILYRFGANLYYANESRMREEIMEIVRTAKTPIRWFCISASSINDIDYSGAEALRQIHRFLVSQGVSLVFSHLEENVRIELDKDGFLDLIGREFVFASKDDVYKEYMEKYSSLPMNIR